MKFIPLIKVKNIARAVDFYTCVLDFECLLTETDGMFGISVMVLVDDVDLLYRKYLKRGLVLPKKENSPVHEKPIDQSWGLREFYVTDEDGNTLRFATAIIK